MEVCINSSINIFSLLHIIVSGTKKKIIEYSSKKPHLLSGKTQFCSCCGRILDDLQNFLSSCNICSCCGRILDDLPTFLSSFNISEEQTKYLNSPHASESVYVQFCRTFGTSQDVNMRREMGDLKEVMNNKILLNGYIVRLGGSKREGFRHDYNTDLDTMMWLPEYRVIWDLKQRDVYNLNRTILLLADCSQSKPGYALLQIHTSKIHSNLFSACIRMNNKLYISSSKYRKSTHFNSMKTGQIGTEKGPCSSGFIGESPVFGIEVDYAYSFVSDFWPPSVQSSWLDRCHSWPPPPVVQDIVRNGCHLVAIGHKKGKLRDVEWRISFACAETKLVYSMNHCQFLTYRLLKLFLKEVVNSGVDHYDELLSSYHMKTVMFWIIQQNTIPIWCPQNLLQCFWTCFELLLKWVSEKICPNFFIPENNMFLSNIHGEAQSNLLERLKSIHNKGLASLLYIPTMDHTLMDLYDPTISICTDEQTLISEGECDLELLHETCYHDIFVSCFDLHYSMQYLNLIEQLINSSQTQPRIALLQKSTVTILLKNAFEISLNTSGNKTLYVADRMSCHMLKLAAKFGCISDMLYIAIYYYRTLRYQDALKVIDTTKVKLAKPYVMYHTTQNKERYCDAVGGQSWSTKLRQALALDIGLDLKVCYINELIPELQCRDIFGGDLPPFVLLHMLEFLCYRQMDTTKAQKALDDLRILLYDDHDMYLHFPLNDLSWQVLGICEQIAGKLGAAFYSYQRSYRQFPTHNLENVTLMRTLSILGQIYKSGFDTSK